MMEFTVDTARQFAQQDDLEAWIHAYLNTGSWANPEFSQGLRLQPRWWIGPLEIPLSRLNRCCGPEADMEYQVSSTSWEDRVTRLAQTMTDPLRVPPLIVQYRADGFSLRDGNHRHEAMRRKGWETCWVVIWYDRQQDVGNGIPNHLIDNL